MLVEASRPLESLWHVEAELVQEAFGKLTGRCNEGLIVGEACQLAEGRLEDSGLPRPLGYFRAPEAEDHRGEPRAAGVRSDDGLQVHRRLRLQGLAVLVGEGHRFEDCTDEAPGNDGKLNLRTVRG